MHTDLKKRLLSSEIFRDGAPEVWLQVPCRINIIGEHIDYSGGTVVPFASSPVMLLAGKIVSGAGHRIYSADLDRHMSPDNECTGSGWTRYFTQLFRDISGHIPEDTGIHIALASNIPIGGGLSSSTALCCGAIALLCKLLKLPMSPREVIDLASRVEYEAGVEGGLMDQYAIMYGKKGYALELDCSTNRFRYLNLWSGFHFLLIDTAVSHDLKNSPFNKRKKELNQAITDIQKIRPLEGAFPGPEDLQWVRSEAAAKRLRHQIEERQRVRSAISAIQNKDREILGDILFDAHRSLKYNYEVSCKEADYIVDWLKAKSSCAGARIMGGGFGGHILVLAGSSDNMSWKGKLAGAYHRETGLNLVYRSIIVTDSLSTI